MLRNKVTLICQSVKAPRRMIEQRDIREVSLIMFLWVYVITVTLLFIYSLCHFRHFSISVMSFRKYVASGVSWQPTKIAAHLIVVNSILTMKQMMKILIG